VRSGAVGVTAARPRDPAGSGTLPLVDARAGLPDQTGRGCYAEEIGSGGR